MVEQEAFLVEYLDTHVLELELNKSEGGRRGGDQQRTLSKDYSTRDL